MLLGLAIWQIPTWNDIKKKFPKDGELGKDGKPMQVLTVDVIGEQFKWNVRYPGSKAKYKGENEYTNLSKIHMPFGHAAFFNIRSKDVIHSVFIPHMRVKQDTVPGLRQKIWFKPNRFFIVDLKAGREKTGNNIYVMESNEWVKKEQEIQPKRFVYLDDEPLIETKLKEPLQQKMAFLAKDFAPGGTLYDKKIAVDGHSEQNSIYEVAVIKGVAKKVRVLYQGKVTDGQFADCDYAMGIFEIACAELCGLGHYTMRAFLYVEPMVSFDAWIRAEVEDADKPPVVWTFWRD
jgi:hypothetical protein